MGTFLKTPSSIIAEVLGHTELDVVCLDVEHAPFGRIELDQCLGSLCSADMPSLVRVADDSPTQIRNALDSGATGIVVPHVTTVEQASAIVKAAHFGDGGRGYAGSSRAADFTNKTMADHIADSSAQTTVIVQIEDIDALLNVADIAALDGIDALFIGRVDLAVAMGKPVSDAAVVDAVRQICASARDAKPAVGMFTPDMSELPDWIDAGASLFLLSSDQSFVLAGANALAQSMP
jgi:2-keto-3-deoxy-L-rhamnonate aldolase RhmA